MSHEVEHVCRRDNLTAAIHALVEAIFWFHPLVRWMSVKLNEERERACDESVLERNARPEAYADSILKVCAFCLEPPSPCVSGVSGADLKERILRIMAQRSGAALNSWRKIVARLCCHTRSGHARWNWRRCTDRAAAWHRQTRRKAPTVTATFRSTTWPVSSHTKPTTGES